MTDEYCLIRNATAVLTYGGMKFLIDPALAPMGAYPAVPGTVNAELRNPLVALPMTVEEVLSGVDAVILTRLCRDHWDEAAMSAIPASLPFLVPSSEDAATLAGQGFKNTRVVSSEGTQLDNNVTLYRTHGHQGPPAATPSSGHPPGAAHSSVAGLVFQRPGAKTVFVGSDSVWCPEVAAALASFAPDYVVLNVGDACVEGIGPIMMHKDDVLEVVKAVPKAVIVAQHLEAVNHCVLSRQVLREFVAIKGVASHVFIPADGECVLISS